MTGIRRIAMWSPPRARSTLMMRVFEALGCAVFDEPFYAYWLRQLDKRDDPGFAETLAAHPSDWREVTELVVGDVPGNKLWFYQKHMAIHMLPEVSLEFMAHPEMLNCFLIRDPREVIVSMTEFRDLVQVSETQGVDAAARLVGIPQLQRIYDRAHELSGSAVPIIDANDVLCAPEQTLGAFCSAVGLPFDATKPLTWAAGQHEADGAWAPMWYNKVFATTKLGTFTRRDVDVPDALQPIVDACMPTYESLHAQRLR